MDRQQKIDTIKAIASGNLETIAKRVPQIYADKFTDRNMLIKGLQRVFGPDARVLFVSGAVWVISEFPGIWWFYKPPDKPYSCGSLFGPGDGSAFTDEEFKTFCQQLDANGPEARVITWKHQEGNDPIVDNDEGR